MIYIRTKSNEIFECERILSTYGEANGNSTYKYLCKSKDGGEPVIIYQEDTIKQSAGIMGVCDDFVLTKDLLRFNQTEEEIKKIIEENICCYGCIWSKDGLKYVAQLNEKGEWKLI